ncbi:MAG: hypothetical protein GY804_08535 [Alphaproteobacteria bacterium]|nr:hypothetical protein [Alphaproteobacteria bacterium]
MNLIDPDNKVELIDLFEEVTSIADSSASITEYLQNVPWDGEFDSLDTEDKEEIQEHRDMRGVVLDCYVLLEKELAAGGIYVTYPRELLYENYRTLRVIISLKKLFGRTYLDSIIKNSEDLADDLEAWLSQREDESSLIDPDTKDPEEYESFIQNIITTIGKYYPLNADLVYIQDHIDYIGNSEKFAVYLKYIIDNLREEVITATIDEDNVSIVKFLHWCHSRYLRMTNIFEFCTITIKQYKLLKYKTSVEGLLKTYHFEKYRGDLRDQFNRVYTAYNLIPAESEIEVEHRAASKHHIEYWENHQDTEITIPQYIVYVLALFDDFNFDIDRVQKALLDQSKLYPFTSDMSTLGQLISTVKYTK